jgi:hypothetical protein
MPDAVSPSSIEGTGHHITKFRYQFSVKLKMIESKPRQNPPDQDCFTSFFLLVLYAL